MRRLILYIVVLHNSLGRAIYVTGLRISASRYACSTWRPSVMFPSRSPSRSQNREASREVGVVAISWNNATSKDWSLMSFPRRSTRYLNFSRGSPGSYPAPFSTMKPKRKAKWTSVSCHLASRLTSLHQRIPSVYAFRFQIRPLFQICVHCVMLFMYSFPVTGRTVC